MAVRIKQHIEVTNDDPLQVTIAGTSLKAYLVAKLALMDGIDAAINQYDLTPAEVHAVLVFYYDNQDAVELRLEEKERWLKENAISGTEKLRLLRPYQDEN
jgi:hypothetical protein